MMSNGRLASQIRRYRVAVIDLDSESITHHDLKELRSEFERNQFEM